MDEVLARHHPYFGEYVENSYNSQIGFLTVTLIIEVH